MFVTAVQFSGIRFLTLIIFLRLISFWTGHCISPNTCHARAAVERLAIFFHIPGHHIQQFDARLCRSDHSTQKYDTSIGRQTIWKTQACSCGTRRPYAGVARRAAEVQSSTFGFARFVSICLQGSMEAEHHTVVAWIIGFQVQSVSWNYVGQLAEL